MTRNRRQTMKKARKRVIGWRRGAPSSSSKVSGPPPPANHETEHEPIPPVPWATLLPRMRAMHAAAGEYGLVQAFIAVLSEKGTHVKMTLTFRGMGSKS